MDIYLKKQLGALRPADAMAEEQMAELPEGAVVRARVTRPRSVQHHRLFFALLKLVHENSPAGAKWPLLDDFREIVTIGAGYYRWIELPNGKRESRAQSIAFHKMDQNEFNKFFEAAIDCIANKLRLVDEASLRREFNEMLGEAAA